MATTNYYSVNGQIVGEKTAGSSRVDYLTDALGSVTGTVDQSANVINTYRYKPYGGLLAKTGVGSDPAFQWVGAQGYRQTGKQYSDVYIRARHYSSNLGRWITKDPMGCIDGLNCYAYGANQPSITVDPSGLADCKSKGISLKSFPEAIPTFGKGDCILLRGYDGRLKFMCQGKRMIRGQIKGPCGKDPGPYPAFFQWVSGGLKNGDGAYLVGPYDMREDRNPKDNSWPLMWYRKKPFKTCQETQGQYHIETVEWWDYPAFAANLGTRVPYVGWMSALSCIGCWDAQKKKLTRKDICITWGYHTYVDYAKQTWTWTAK